MLAKTRLREATEYLRIDDVREDLDIQVPHSNDVWRGCGTAVASLGHNLLEGWVAGAADDADGQRTNDEEDTESGVDHLEGALDVDSGALRLGGDHGDVLGTDDGERGRPQCGQEAFEFGECARFSKVWLESIATSEVTEAVGVALRVTADHGDEGEEEQREDQNDLAAGKPELSLSVCFDSENVNVTRRESAHHFAAIAI